MRTARFWTGVAILSGLAMVILITIPAWRVAPSGPVTGTVFLHGRPLTGGMIYLDPDEPRRGESTCARIDENGRFAFDPEWRRDRAPRMRFRMRIVPIPRHLPVNPPGSDRGEGRATDDAAGPGPAADGGRSPTVVRTSWSSDGPDPPERSVGAGRRVSRLGPIIERKVWLGPEPAHIELDLRD